MKYPKFLSWTIPFTKRIGIKDNAKVLDVGCGSGKILRELNTNGRLCVGLDIIKANLIEAHKKDGNINFVFGDACSLPFKDKTFDVVMSRQFVSHVWKLDASIKEMKRVCCRLFYLEDSNILNPVVTFALILKYGFRWLWNKRKSHFSKKLSEFAKCEDIHSIFWWKRKMAPIKVKSRRVFSNRVLNSIWKYFGPDCIFVQEVN